MISAVMPIALLPDWLSAEGLFQILGPWALIGFTVILFLECGLFIGMFFPGDSLLFLTGLLVATGAMTEPLWLVMVVFLIAAILGNIVGYHFGAAIGPRLLNRPNSRFLRPEYVRKTHEFFEKHGSRAIVLARFVPIVRTLITAVAGIAGMDRTRFYVYSAVGAMVWVIGVTGLGSLLGEVEFVRANLEPILLGMVFVSVIPIVVEIRKNRP